MKSINTVSEKSQILMIRKQPSSERLIMLKLQSIDIFASQITQIFRLSSSRAKKEEEDYFHAM